MLETSPPSRWKGKRNRKMFTNDRRSMTFIRRSNGERENEEDEGALGRWTCVYIDMCQ